VEVKRLRLEKGIAEEKSAKLIKKLENELNAVT
jgi:hypothetical protein